MYLRKVAVAGTLAVMIGAVMVAAWASDTSTAKEDLPVAKVEKKAEKSGQTAKIAKIRVGIYDNRAITCAYAPSKLHNDMVAKKMEEYKKAEAAGDKKRCAELKAWGQKGQRQLHRQGFCAVPVDDLLAHVKDGMAKLAEKENLDLIVWRYDYASKNVKIIDITDQIVALYHPTKKTLRFVEAVKKYPPISLEVLEKHGHDH